MSPMSDVRCPAGLRPGQLSLLVIRRVIMGDIAVTIIDLAQRGVLAVDGQEDAWHVRVLPGQASRPGQPELHAYERELLAALPMPADGQPAPALPDLAATMGTRLDRVRAEIEKEAVHSGWVHHWHHGDLTESGERLVAELGRFGGQLRELKAERGDEALTGDLLPYALRFHLLARDQAPLARFAAAWAEAFAGLPGWKAPDYKHPKYDDDTWVQNRGYTGYPTGWGLAPWVLSLRPG
jgi:hypothetical protein